MPEPLASHRSTDSPDAPAQAAPQRQSGRHAELEERSAEQRNRRLADTLQRRPQAAASATALAGQGRTAAGPSPRNRTGLPDSVKRGVEALSGLSMDDVKVRYGSPEPARVQALAFTRGSEIHVAPGAERHVAHEAWHVVQQKQGRVRPTGTVGGLPLNDDPGLEREADAMGLRAAAAHSAREGPPRHASGNAVVQRLVDLTLPDGRAGAFGAGDSKDVWPHVRVALAAKGHSAWGRKKKLDEHLAAAGVVNASRMTANEYADFLVGQTPRASKHGKRPDWDSFWKGVKVDGMHRRHVVMSSVMRNAVYAVTKLANDDATKTKTAEAYSALLGKGGSPGAADLQTVETELVSRLHSHKLNIFIEEGPWNSAIGGIAHAVITEHDRLSAGIEAADNVDKLKAASAEIAKAIRAAKVFTKEAEKKREEIAGVADAMIEATITGASALDEIKAGLQEILEEMIDSMSSDVSQASDPAVMKEQNQLFAYNAHFLAIAKSPDLGKFTHVAAGFLGVEAKVNLTAASPGAEREKFYKAVTSEKQKHRVAAL
jgi:hypothetical protein